MKIIWDEAIYIDSEEFSGKIIHVGIKYIDRYNSQVPTVIAKGAKVHDEVIPTDNIYYVKWDAFGGRIIERAIFPRREITKEKLKELMQKYIGKKVRVLLPLEIEGIINEYIFTFKVEDFVIDTPH